MQQQITHENHYVPQWYQKGFLAKRQHKLHVLNLHPAAKPLPSGQTLLEPEVEELGPKLAFKELDLYTTRLGHTLNDEIETFLFGKIDKRGADAVRAWIAGNHVQIHRGFHDFFEYMDAQKLRTPKGLDWILKHYKACRQDSCKNLPHRPNAIAASSYKSSVAAPDCFASKTITCPRSASDGGSGEL